MSSGTPRIACATCGHEPVDLLRMTVVYETALDFKTKESVHRHARTDYHTRCPVCGSEALIVKAVESQ